MQEQISLPPKFMLFDREVQPDEKGFYCEIFSNKELTNDQYHSEEDHVSGSSLSKLFNTCPAKFKFGVETDENGEPVTDKSRALEFGSCGHTNLLEPDLFAAEYLRGTRKEDAAKLGGVLLATQAACQSWLKERGIKGYSGKGYPDLIKMINEAKTPDDKVFILAEIEAEEEKRAKDSGMTLIRGDDYDACVAMRNVLFANSEFEEILTKGAAEVSIFTVLFGVPVKVRLDYVYDWIIIDYKTTVSAKPEEFSRQAYNAGYYLKMALQRAVFKLAYGRPPEAVKLLAQEKKYPYIPQMLKMKNEQLKIGHIQLSSALQQYKFCKDADVWPGYCNGNEAEMPTPAFVLNQYKDMIK